jgi:hypothetical protein
MDRVEIQRQLAYAEERVQCGMKHAEIQRQLAYAEERVQRGIKHVERQRGVVERLKRHGLRTNRAKRELGALTASLRRRQADRGRLLAELEQVLRRQLPGTDGSAAEGVDQVWTEK